MSGKPIQYDSNTALLAPENSISFFGRWSWLILLLTFASLPFLIYGGVKSLKVAKSEIREWLPEGFDEAVAYDAFVTNFGIDEMVVISWDGAVLDDEDSLARISALKSMLSEEKIGDQPLFTKLFSGPDMLGQIQKGQVGYESALSRVSGLLVGRDRKTTCIVGYPSLTMKLASGELAVDRILVMEKIAEIAARAPVRLSSDQLKMAGPTIDGAVMDLETKKSLRRYLGMTVLAVFLVSWIRLKDFSMAAISVLFSLLSTAFALSILYYSGGKMTVTMILLPTMCFILGISGCVHIINYYRNSLDSEPRGFAADKAAMLGLRPCLMSSVTTAIGMFSLGVSKIEPIRHFGYYSGFGVLAGLLVILLVLPATMHVMESFLSKKKTVGGGANPQASVLPKKKDIWSGYVNWVSHEHALTTIVFLLTGAVIAIGLFRIESSVKLQNRFSDRVKLLQDYEWLEDKLGPLVPMEVVLSFPADSKLDNWEKLQIVKRLERSIRQTTSIRATLSAATYEPELPRGKRLGDKIERRTILDKWNNEFEQLIDGKLVSVTDGVSKWRISARIAAMNDLDYGDLIENIRSNVSHQLENLEEPGITGSVTGAIPLLHKAQHQILSDLAWSFVTAFIFISAVMWILLRNLAAGLISMLPNIFPPIFIFGLMGWMGKKVEIGSVLTASIALGIAVDDTIHFLVWYRGKLSEGMPRFKAIRDTFQHCAKAMIDTSLICICGVAPFLFSTYMPSYNFALLLTGMLAAALLGDLILLPALLAGPLGNFFRPRAVNQTHGTSPHESTSPRSSTDKTELDETDFDQASMSRVSDELPPPPHSRNLTGKPR